MNKQYFVFILTICITYSLNTSFGQTNFALNGNAKSISDSTFELTPDAPYTFGSMWYKQKADLSKDFSISFELFFGNKDFSGADGITFAFQGQCTNAGNFGGGIGIKGISPSFFIEFDTYQNNDSGEPYDDPSYDHIGILKNGIVDHGSTSSLAGPVRASSLSNNIEDSLYHVVKIDWNAASKTLEVSFDNVKRLSYTGDVVKDIFNDDPFVFWGFTASTGGLDNVQTVKILPTKNETICKGNSIPLTVVGPQNGINYTWAPATGLNTITGKEVIAAPEVTTTYTVVSSGSNCGDISFSFTVNVIDTLPPIVISPKTDVCKGDTVTYNVLQSSGNTYTWNVIGAAFNTIASNKINVYVNDSSYTVKIAAGNSFCKQFASDSALITVRSKPETPKIISKSTQYCIGDTIILSTPNTLGSIYKWTIIGAQQYTNLDNTVTIVLKETDVNISLSETNIYGCKNLKSNDTTVMVTKVEKPKGKLQVLVLCNEKGVTLDMGSGYSNYYWLEDKTTTQNTIKYTAGNFFGQSSNECGTKTDTFAVKEGRYNVPNIITPNQDGLNDKLIFNNINEITPMSVGIVNRWGTSVFNSKQYQNDWGGGDCSDGIYYYTIQTLGCEIKKGWIQIAR